MNFSSFLHVGVNMNHKDCDTIRILTILSYCDLARGLGK